MLSILTSEMALKPEPKAARREFLTPLPNNDYLLIIDNSSLEKWKRCAVAARNYIILGREAYAKDAALTLGGAVHVGIEKLLRGEDVLAIATAVQQYFLDNPTPPDETRTVHHAVAIVGHYANRAKLPDYQWEILRDTHGELLIECPFELPLGVIPVNKTLQGKPVRDIHVAWSGRMDVIANVQRLNRVCDHKTCLIAGDQFVQSFQLASQTVGYVWAARQLWPEHDIRGFCLNAIHFKKPAAGVGLTDKGPRGGEPALTFFRAFFDYSDSQIVEWQRDTLAHISDFIYACVRDHFPANDSQCFNKYGRCPYFDCCSMDNKGVAMRYLLSHAYAPVTWNPVADR